VLGAGGVLGKGFFSTALGTTLVTVFGGVIVDDTAIRCKGVLHEKSIISAVECDAK
jgi:hypothetical protein